jgi:hypothetical protein
MTHLGSLLNWDSSEDTRRRFQGLRQIDEAQRAFWATIVVSPASGADEAVDGQGGAHVDLVGQARLQKE